MDYTYREMMAIAAAREIRDNEIVFCGTGISMLAAMAAKHISAPNSVIFFETGAIDSLLEEIPMAVADPRVMYGTSFNGGLADAFATMQNRFTGPQVVGILGAAQIDPYGNLNSTAIGDYHQPKVRFSGSGGACDVASFVGRTIIFMQQVKGRFVKKLDYFTSPGYLEGGRSRELAGLRPGGPAAVITDKGIFRFDEETKRMYLAGFYQGVKIDDIMATMDFAVESDRALSVPAASATELCVLREICDPQGLIR
ncbi:MAG: ketoacid-CoA transferase [Deltaproteobacteria bacterium]|nr:ketoacid-CoA transferase [Candidatus Anaeroferrophillus wilburensis]MBN2888162.1 ketoacid-CoA transferase [Deltaproteobacteria bacterium]